MFYILAGLYFVMMFTGHLFLAKPAGWVEPQTKKTAGSVLAILKNKTFIGVWIMFYINITCGLALISQEKSIIKAIGLASAVGLISSLTAIFNAGGRLGFSAWTDRMKDRNTVYKMIFILSIVFTGLVILTSGISNGLAFLVIPLLFVVNAGYGGGFSNVPTLLSDHFGMDSISQIHGLCLSAWAFAGLTGNQIATYIVNHTGKFNASGQNPTGYQNVLYLTFVLYIIALLVCSFMIPKVNKKQ